MSVVKKEDNITHVVINNVKIRARKSDLMVDATELCQAAGKKFNDYIRLKSTKAFIGALETETTIPAVALVQVSHGGNEIEHTWVHRKVAYHIAIWASPKFAVEVTNWLDELFAMGKVDLALPAPSNLEIEQNLRDKLEILENKLDLQEQALVIKDGRIKDVSTQLISVSQELSRLRRNHTSLLKRRDYHKLRTGNCIYIVSDSWREKQYLKYGISNDINERLRQYRVIAPQTAVHILLYTDMNEVLEKLVEKRYHSKRCEANHEYLRDVEVETIRQFLVTMVEGCHLQATFETEEMINSYNESAKCLPDTDDPLVLPPL